MARPALIDRTRVVEAALGLADEEGLTAVTMQAVARRLGVTPMALYRHVADKDDLLDALVERLLAEIEAPPQEAVWSERLAHLGRSMRAVARRHPDVFALLLQRPAATAAARATRDQVVSALADAGASRSVAARLERVIASAILGFAASEATGRFREHSSASIDADYAMLERIIRTGLEAEVRSPRR